MSLTQAQYLTEIRAMADATSSARWSDTTILRLMDTVFKREWSRILNANRYYRIGTRTVTLNSDGQFALSSLNSGSGDSAETFYKIIGVHDGTHIFEAAELRDNMLTASSGVSAGSPWRQFWRVGDYVAAYPFSNGETLNVVVNHIPVLPNSLSASSATVVFPAGFESILIFETAAYMLMKGGAESDASQELKGLAEEIRGEMLADVSRMTTDPQLMRYSDSRLDWGG